MPLGSIVEEVNVRAGKSHLYPVLSVTKHKGFVQSSEYFKKRVFSENTSEYKLVQRGQFAYSTIHLDEGAIGYLEKLDAGIISPMYKVFRLKSSDSNVDPAFLFHILKSDPLVEKYRNLGKGSIKRRKSVSFEKFCSISIPIPPKSIQERLVAHIVGVQELESKLENSRIDLACELEKTLKIVGIS